MIKPANYICERCGIIKEPWINTENPMSKPCCNRLMIPITVQMPGFRTDHTWDDELMTR